MENAINRPGIGQRSRTAAIPWPPCPVLLTTSSDRYLRNHDFDPKKSPDVVPKVAEFELFLKRCGRDITFLTLLHPDMPWKKVRGSQSKMGQKATGNRGGRPRKNKPGHMKQRRLEELNRVLRLHRKGMSFSKIKKLTGVARTTAYDWVQQYQK